VLDLRLIWQKAKSDPGWQGRHPFAVSWIVAFLLYATIGHRYGTVPVYWDALLTWDAAAELHKHPWLPFILQTTDNGHPPFVAWVLSVVWFLPLPGILAIHLVTWAGAATLLSSVFLIGYLSFGFGVGLASALLTAFHPVVAGQSLQLNLDIFLAAFAFLALAGAATGRPGMLATGCVSVAMVKLNGIFALGPFLIWALLGCVCHGRWRNPRFVFSAFWPMGLTILVFVEYHLAKIFVTGHVFDDTTLEGGHQLALVSSLASYFTHVYHSTYQMLAANGNIWVVAALLAATVILPFSLCFPSCRNEIKGWLISRNNEDENVRLWQPMRPVSVLVLLWLMLIVQLSFQSLRDTWTLVRYFMVCYPTLYITLFALISIIFHRFRALAIAMLAVSLLGIFFLKWHPSNVGWITPPLREFIIYPSPTTPTNYENNIQFVDQLPLLRATVEYLNKHYDRGTSISAPWPFDRYLVDPAQGITAFCFNHVSWHQIHKKKPEIILDFSCGKPRLPSDRKGIPHDYRLVKVFSRGQVWIALYQKRIQKMDGTLLE